METMPRYPDIQIQLHSHNPFALVSAVRQELRRRHVDAGEIARFTAEALSSEEPTHVRDVCTSWATVEVLP